MTHTKPLEIVLLGDPGTGKTNLLSRFTSNHFNPKYEPTNGMNVENHTLLVGDQTVEMDLLDLVGHKKWRHLTDRHLHNAGGILLVYDISNPATFETLREWLRLIRPSASPKAVIKLVGNKSDLQDRAVSIKKAQQFATDNGLSYIETSALNNSNVHVAFESIAQEIDVAMHSVSPKASSGHDDDQQDKSFQVVLIDIEQAARDKYIVCVEKPLDEANLEFIAISYRWGEVDEQVIDTKLGYMASVTSFGMKDFYQLCQDMMRESDLQSIKYVWVDAICVDQNNQARRKATIYQMSNIYHRAAYILAVPDLHFQYLHLSNIADVDCCYNAFEFKELIYYLLHEKTEQLGRITEEWYDEMGLPKASMARKGLTSKPRECFMKYFQEYSVQDAKSSCHDNCQHNCYSSMLSNGEHCEYNSLVINCHDTPNGILGHIQGCINRCHAHAENTTMVYENSDCDLCSLQMDMCKHQGESLSKNEILPDSDQKWLACVLKEFLYEKYRTLVAERSQAVNKIIAYLEDLIMDWSSRVWVISEYNIAKQKQSRKMKFWFLSLCIDWNTFEKLDFFVFDFDNENSIDSVPGNVTPSDFVIYEAYDRYRDFHFRLMMQLNRQSFLEMMLRSKASRNEDRFYAIFPSSEYKDMLTSREVVSSWQIDNIVSVKLKLYELMTTKDKLDLLYLSARNQYQTVCTFPAFAHVNLGIWDVPPVKEQSEKGLPCNFDLNNNAALRLIPPANENGSHFYKLRLSPKMYYALNDGTAEVKELFDTIFNDNKKLWQTLEINYVDDELVFVSIPIYMYNIDRQDIGEFIDDIVLFGSFKESKWLLCDALYSYSKSSHHLIVPFEIRFPWKRYNNSDGNTSFDIY